MSAPVVLITGASRGIGAACADMFAANGYRVGVNYTRGKDAAEAVVARIRAAGGEAESFVADVGDESAVADMFTSLDKSFGRIDVLVNNAGIVGPRCRVDELSVADLRRMLDVNVLGAYVCAQHAIRRMSTNHGGDGGAIVNVSSGSAYIGNPTNGVHYAITKGALNSFNIGASQQLVREGIRVNAVSPGMTVTDMTSDIADNFVNLPMQRAAEPEEIAEAIYWLATDKASYVAGANIRVGGGRP
ncbi:MAG: NAD(P)-dependent oxidoreductase [Gammaproteobacteria bacterium]|nr:NAD(P)-dependent oxidoreductase [Gammaproteobacteria bacterium]